MPSPKRSGGGAFSKEPTTKEATATMKRFLVLWLSLCVWAFSHGSAIAQEKAEGNSIGLGLGIPYGILGINVDVNLISNIDASFGIGSTIYEHVGFEGGLKYYLASSEDALRPRVSWFYGTNNIVYFDLNEDLDENYSGMALGFGMRFFPETSHYGLDIDVFYLATTNYRKQIPNAALSLGFRRSF
jgi:hypothetical protein